MKTLTAGQWRDLGTRLFAAAGAPEQDAAIVASELVDASLMGLDSHGITRFIHYMDEIRIGRLKPGAPITIVRETPTTAIVDCGLNFGPVSAIRMVDIVCAKAEKYHLALAISRHCHHVSRLGAYVQKIAERGLFSFGTANSSKHGHFVVPWGGRDGRLATNPLAYAVPSADGHPVVLDMSTAMIAEGKIRVLLHQGKPMPPGCVLDGEGRPTTDPKAFYGPPRGTILPFGGELGYKGFGLSLLVELLSSTLEGEAVTDEFTYMNGLALLAINPDAFCGKARFAELVRELSQYVTSSRPAEGGREVVMPGEYDFRTKEKRLREGISVADETWRLIVEAGAGVGLKIEE